jgi:integrase/recombinase XerD
MSTDALQLSVLEYLEDVRASKSPATHGMYSSILRDIFLPWAASQSLAEPSAVDAKAMDSFTAHLRIKNRRGKLLSVTTVRTYLRAVRVYLNWAEIPRGRFKAPKPVRNHREVLNRNEIQRLEDACLEERDRLIVRVLGDCGLRVGELLSLQRDSLREDNYSRQCSLLVDGKTGPRLVAISTPVFKRLKHFAETNKLPYIFNGKRRRSNGEVEPLTYSGVDQLIRHLAIRAEIGKRTYPHLFRHSWITHLIEKGVSPLVIQQQAGHSSLSMIATTYGHVRTATVHEELMKALK